jgi:hypothetical protein
VRGAEKLILDQQNRNNNPDSSYGWLLAKHRKAHVKLVERWELKPDKFAALRDDYKVLLEGYVPPQVSSTALSEYKRYLALSTSF